MPLVPASSWASGARLAPASAWASPWQGLVAPLTLGALRVCQPIEGRDVAAAIVASIAEGERGEASSPTRS